MASTADTVAEWTTPAKVEEFRSALGTKLDPAIFPSDDRTLKRYLVARKGDIAEASKMILRSQQWRQDDCVPYGYPSRPVPLDSIRACLNTKAAYIHGVDREKRPIVWVKGKLHDGNLDRSAVQKWIIHLLDEVVTRCNTTGFAPQFTGVIDAGDMGWSNVSIRRRGDEASGALGVLSSSSCFLPLLSHLQLDKGALNFLL
jgi:CRAL/TRIO domain